MNSNPRLTAMKINRWMAVLVLLLGLGGTVCFILGRQQTANDVALTKMLNPRLPALLGKKPGDTTWLWLPKRSTQLVVLKTTSQALLDDFADVPLVSYRVDTVLGINKVTDLYVGKRRLAQLLADSLRGDTTQQWQQTLIKLERFVADEAATDDLAKKIKNTDALLLHRVWSKINSLQNRHRLTYVLERSINTEPLEKIMLSKDQRLQLALVPATAPYSPVWSWLALGLGLAASFLGVWGWMVAERSPLPERNPKEEKVEVEIPFTPQGESEEQATQEENSLSMLLSTETMAQESNYEAEWNLINRYAKQLYERYGDLFEKLQEGNMPPTETERENILRKLVELALHAHTFAHFGMMDKLGRLEESPNVRLLLENINVSQLPEDQREIFTTRPDKTGVKYRALYEVLKSLNIKQLNVLTEDRIYISEEFWEKK
ncbi:MAG: hypothetical protein U0X91_27810 [Spirosomataceae bacterium]